MTEVSEQDLMELLDEFDREVAAVDSSASEPSAEDIAAAALEAEEAAAVAAAPVAPAEVVSAPVAAATDPEPAPKRRTRAKKEEASAPVVAVEAPSSAAAAETSAPAASASASDSPFSADELGEEDLSGSADKPTPALAFYVDVDKFKRDTSISETNLDNCMFEQSSLRVHYGVQAARAEAQAARAKIRFEVLEARLNNVHRKKQEDAGLKVTEKTVEAAVKLDPQWASGRNTLIEAESIADVLRALVSSLNDRRDMLIQLGSDRRQEVAGGLRVVSKPADAGSIAQRAVAAARQAM